MDNFSQNAQNTPSPRTIETVLCQIRSLYEKQLYGFATFQAYYTAQTGSPSETFTQEIEEKEMQYTSLLNRLERTKQKQQRWEQQDMLAAQYFLIRLETGRGTAVENRTPRQREIVETVVSRMNSYFWHIANRLLYCGEMNPKTGKMNYPVFIKGHKMSLNQVRGRVAVDDLVQEGALAIMEKFQVYNPCLGSVTAWAQAHITGAMTRYAAQENLISIPINVYDETKKIAGKSSRGDFFRVVEERGVKGTSRYQGKPHYQKLSFLSAAAVRMALTGTYMDIWEKVVNHGGDLGHQNTFEEVYLPDEETPSAEEHIAAQELPAKVQQVLGTLNPRERRVISGRFGFEDGEAQTLEEIGKEFNVSRERIRQMEAKALQKLRHPSRAKELLVVMTGEEGRRNKEEVSQTYQKLRRER